MIGGLCVKQTSDPTKCCRKNSKRQNPIGKENHQEKSCRKTPQGAPSGEENAAATPSKNAGTRLLKTQVQG